MNRRTTSATRRPASRPRALSSHFGRYALAAASAGAAATTARADFSGTYALTPPAGGQYTTPMTLGTWNSVCSANPGGEPTRTVDTRNAPSMLTLASGQDLNVNFSTSLLTLSRTVSATTTFSFSYSLSDTNSLSGNPPSYAAYVINGTATNFATDTSNSGSSTLSGNVMNIAVPAGSSFGLRLGIGYQNNANLTISNFVGNTVPEPSVCALAAAGAVGLLGLREARRRRRAALSA